MTESSGPIAGPATTAPGAGPVDRADRTLRHDEVAEIVDALRRREECAPGPDHDDADLAAADDHDAAGVGVGAILGHGVAALAVTALALAMVGTIFLVQSAQAEATRVDRVEGTGHPDTSVAVPDDRSDARTPGSLADGQAETSENGDLEAFDRSAEEGTHDQVRAELDRAVAERRADDRQHELARTNAAATDESDGEVVAARNSQLVDQAEATKREQARLEEEKRKAEQALAEKRRRERERAAAGPGTMPPLPDAGSTAVGNGATPMAPGTYYVGARWGAVGSWSRYHTGQDLPGPVGTPIQAAADGVVVAPNGGGWAGTHVVIRHGDGSATLYAHMSGTTVSPGQTVTAGQVIGAVGMTGRTFGPHLHFEHYPNAATVGNPYTTDDPTRWLMGLGVRL